MKYLKYLWQGLYFEQMEHFIRGGAEVASRAVENFLLSRGWRLAIITHYKEWCNAGYFPREGAPY